MSAPEILEEGLEEIRTNQKLQVQEDIDARTAKNRADVDKLYRLPQNADIERRPFLENKIKDLCCLLNFLTK